MRELVVEREERSCDVRWRFANEGFPICVLRSVTHYASLTKSFE